MARGSIEPAGDPVARYLGPVGYLGAAVIVADQLSQMAVALPGFDPGYSIWRFQAANLVASRVPALALGVLLVIAVGGWTGRRRAVRLGSGLAAGLVGVLAVVVLVLWADGAAARDGVPAPALEGFIHRWVRVLATTGLALTLGLGVGWVAWNGRRRGDSG